METKCMLCNEIIDKRLYSYFDSYIRITMHLLYTNLTMKVIGSKMTKTSVLCLNTREKFPKFPTTGHQLKSRYLRDSGDLKI